MEELEYVEGFPKFIGLSESKHSCLRLTEVCNESSPAYGRYWRDGGHWEVNVIKSKDGSFITTDDAPTTNLCNLPVVPVTISEWREDNKGYDSF